MADLSERGLAELDWRLAKEAPDGVPVLTAIIEKGRRRNVTDLVRKGRLWFFPDMSMYVYYTPTHFALHEAKKP